MRRATGYTTRGGTFAKSLRAPIQNMLDTGSTSGVVANGKAGYSPAMFECFTEQDVYDPETQQIVGLKIEESADSHVTPRRSITRAQHLKLFPVTLETEPRIARQLDKGELKKTGNVKLITTTDQRLVWKSDQTLLSRSKPGSTLGVRMGENEGFYRVTSRSKRRTFVEEPARTPQETTERKATPADTDESFL